MPFLNNIITVSSEFIPDLSKKLDSDYTLEKLRQQYIGSCTEENGYILKIESIQEIIDNKLSIYNGHLLLTLKISAVFLKPDKNDIIPCRIYSIKSNGIFAYYQDNILKTYIIHNENSKSVKVEDIVQVKILQYRFKDKVYESVGIIVN